MKKILIIIFIILITGCKNRNVITKNIKKQNCIININYPITSIKKLNKEIKSYIKTNYKALKKNYCSNNNQININFKKIELDNYLTVLINTTTNYEKNIKTFTYNKNTKKKLTLFDILTSNDISILSAKLKERNISLENMNNLDFHFNTKYLTIYINNTKLELPIGIFDLTFKIKNETNSTRSKQN